MVIFFIGFFSFQQDNDISTEKTGVQNVRKQPAGSSIVMHNEWITACVYIASILKQLSAFHVH